MPPTPAQVRALGIRPKRRNRTEQLAGNFAARVPIPKDHLASKLKRINFDKVNELCCLAACCQLRKLLWGTPFQDPNNGIKQPS